MNMFKLAVSHDGSDLWIDNEGCLWYHEEVNTEKSILTITYYLCYGFGSVKPKDILEKYDEYKKGDISYTKNQKFEIEYDTYSNHQVLDDEIKKLGITDIYTHEIDLNWNKGMFQLFEVNTSLKNIYNFIYNIREAQFSYIRIKKRDKVIFHFFGYE